MFKCLLIAPLIIICAILSSRAQASLPDIPVTNEFGVTSPLSKHLNERSLLVMGFYNCKHICDFMVKNLSQDLARFKIYPHVVFFGIDEHEGPRDALKLKKRIVGDAKHHWTFLTTDKTSIHKLAMALPFEMKRDPVSDVITHEIAFYTVENNQVINKVTDLKITEDIFGAPVTALDHIKRFCSEFDPRKSKYGTYVINGLSLLSLAFVGVLVFWFIYLRRKIV
ncbi:SCO family protein [Peredibacter sp. HCB2-198]|uniref:SCO family protein n=1 Tax=Peredibacter sp. HCB2-198 TaxID=3383025 RepID=UPI0038B527BD